ncbi:alcohol dehydrogenase catalytic domain-containing protein [Aurantimonas sp. VKM B-3413]|uniref:alcohol dehydrogenase catalytic domain-containing protein n=1 Tax=Aurantimonas sp. VKM B-3413 TaxID=2779401 RepID=UPI001E2EBE07|nr:alcohol dehydrogenase catalytic domain-containing protein [Aurantimonas sp. VKM B-3413]MCB8838340.1 alcohol dehydrogenase catalytic domain-containing protein [Aurantimonas sp. VKM B-3413]
MQTEPLTQRPQMRAAAFHGEDRITVETRPLPEPAAGEALVKILRTALCGSDFKLWHNGAEHVAGHEIFGRVEQPGHELDGQRCAVYIPVHCGHCAACRAGDTQMCLEVSSLIGWNRDGGYCEYVAVPDNCLLPVPEDIPDDLGPLLLDTIGTSAHAVREAQRFVPKDGDPEVLVTGAGPVGLGVVLALKALGYEKVFVSDPNPGRLAIAVSFGAAAHPVGSRDKRFAMIVECSGAHVARNLAIELVLPKGVIVLVGENAAPWTITEDKVFRRKDFAMLRTFYFPKADLAANIELLRANKDRYARLVDERFGLDALPERFAHFAEGKSIKPVLAFEETR